EFAMVAALDRAAELARHGLFAIADAKHRQARPIEFGRRQRRVGVEDRGRAAGEDHSPWLPRGKGVTGLLERRDLAVDPLFAHAPGDQLGDLGAEVDDQDVVVHVRGSLMLNALATRVRGAEAGMCGAPWSRSSPVSNGPRPGIGVNLCGGGRANSPLPQAK